MMRFSGFVLSVVLFTAISVTPSAVRADDIVFPSFVTNGSFEEWGHYLPNGWHGYGSINAYQADPFYGEYAVQLTNAMPWDGYLYQEIPYRGGPVLFGCAHWSAFLLGDEIIVRYLDAEMNEISHRVWESRSGDWRVIMELLRPPVETWVIRVELVPMLDGIGMLIVDHLFMIPIIHDRVD
jgi:hypothetical protein